MKYVYTFMLALLCYSTLNSFTDQIISCMAGKKIEKLLDEFKRPFTVFELENNNPYSFAISKKYNCVCVVAPLDQILNPAKSTLFLHCQKIQATSLILLNKIKNFNDLQRLSECEHFDVVIGQNVFNFLDINNPQEIDLLCELGEYIFIEIVCTLTDQKFLEKIRTFERGINKHNPVISDLSEPNLMNKLYLIHHPKKILKRKTWVSPLETENNHIIVSSFNEKKLIKNLKILPDTPIESTWIPGINLVTFKALNAIFPTIEMLKATMKKMDTIKTNDFWPNNLIVQGTNITHIDADDPTHGPAIPISKDLIEHIVRFLDLKTINDVFRFYGLACKNFFFSKTFRKLYFELLEG